MHAADALKNYTASELAARIAVGSIDPVEVIQLSSRPGAALASKACQVVKSLAAQKKRERDAGHALGILHGVPVAVFLQPSSQLPDPTVTFRSALSRTGAITISADSAEMAAVAAVGGEVAAAVVAMGDGNDLARRFGLFGFSPTSPKASLTRLSGLTRCADDLPLLPFCAGEAEPLRLSRRSWTVGVAGQAAHAGFRISLAQIAAAGVTLSDIDLAACLSLRKKGDERGEVSTFQPLPATSTVAVTPRRGRVKDNSEAVLASVFGSLDAILIPASVRYEAPVLQGLPSVFVPTCGDGLVILGRPGADRDVLQFARYVEAAFHCMEAAA